MTRRLSPLKITYATLRNDNEQLHANYDAGLPLRAPNSVAPRPVHQRRVRKAGETFEKHSPIDGSLVGSLPRAPRDVRDAVAAAAPLPRVGRTPGWSGSRSCAAWRT